MKRLLSSLTISAAALAGLVVALPAAAQFAKPEDAIKHRKSAMFLEVTHFRPHICHGEWKGAVRRQGGGRKRRSAGRRVEVAVRWLRGRKRQGRHARPSRKSGPRPAKFREKASRSQEDVIKFNAAAKAGNLDAIKTAVGAVPVLHRLP